MAKKNKESRFYDLIPTEYEVGHQSSKKDSAKKPGTLIIFDCPDGIEPMNDDEQLFSFKRDKLKGEDVVQYTPPVDPLTGEYLPWRYDAKKKRFKKPAISSDVTAKAYRDVIQLKAKAQLFGTEVAVKP